MADAAVLVLAQHTHSVPLLAHLEELRKRIIFSVVGVLAGFFVCSNPECRHDCRPAIRTRARPWLSQSTQFREAFLRRGSDRNALAEEHFCVWGIFLT